MVMDQSQLVGKVRSDTPMQWLREERLYRNERSYTTQQGLATRYNIAATTVSNWDRGIFAPKKRIRPDLAKLFDISLEEMETAIVITHNLHVVRAEIKEMIKQGIHDEAALRDAETRLGAYETEALRFKELVVKRGNPSYA